MNHADIFAPIERELALVEKKRQACFLESNSRTIKNINGFLLNSTGKRLRPGLSILSAGAVLGRKSETIHDDLINAAVAIELLHTASLIHDDVIDSATARHNRPTINSKFGSHVSIAVGDYVYSISLKLISLVSNPIVPRCFVQRTFDLCEGELDQIVERKNFQLSPAQYFSIIKRKTGSLFALSGEVGALIADSNKSEHISAMREFGLNFGMAYQIGDDVRDLVASRIELGKEPGVDFQTEELTLPMIFLLNDQRFGAEIKQLLALEDKVSAFEKIRQIALESSALKKAKGKAQSFLAKARKSINPLDSSVYKNQLLALVDWLTETA
ncbi:MAG: polyprenyl synthetase family protein [Candidatus Riflebacteria bacterium]|nr:polyprenyl synthetase family protein [Candidatus Riflebacteria bacterium]